MPDLSGKVHQPKTDVPTTEPRRQVSIDSEVHYYGYVQNLAALLSAYSPMH